MKMRNLGKIFITILMLSLPLFSSVSAKLSPKIAYVGDVVTLSLKIDGEDIQKPTLIDVCGHNIIASGSSTSIEMIGSDYKKTYTLNYQFVAQKSCRVDPIEVVIDGKVEKTQPVELIVKKISQNANVDFYLQYHTSKKTLYVGESFDVTLTLRQKKDANVVDSKFIPSAFKGFWKKGESKPTREDDGRYLITKVVYTLAAQREGNLTIKPAQLQVASRVASRSWSPTFMPQVQWKSYFSNSLSLDVKPIPNGANIIGDLSIDAIADKTVVHPTEAVNVTLRISGKGNLEDIEGFKPYIDGVSVFDEKPQVGQNNWTQKLTFVSDTNFTIPSMSLKYFDTNMKQVREIATKPIVITVVGSKSKPKPLTIKTAEATQQQHATPQEQSSNDFSLFYVIVAFFVGVGMTLIIVMFPKKITKKEKKINPIKDEKLLLVKLLPFKDGDGDVGDIVSKLESNLYEGGSEKVDKKLVKELLKRYNIS